MLFLSITACVLGLIAAFGKALTVIKVSANETVDGLSPTSTVLSVFSWSLWSFLSLTNLWLLTPVLVSLLLDWVLVAKACGVSNLWRKVAVVCAISTAAAAMLALLDPTAVLVGLLVVDVWCYAAAGRALHRSVAAAAVSIHSWSLAVLVAVVWTLLALWLRDWVLAAASFASVIGATACTVIALAKQTQPAT